MTPSDILRLAWRNSTIVAAGNGAVLALFEGATRMVDIPLASPIGTADETGIALATTEFAQIMAAGAPDVAVLYSANGDQLAVFSAGVAPESGPAPDLLLPLAAFNAGAFVRLTNSRLNLA